MADKKKKDVDLEKCGPKCVFGNIDPCVAICVMGDVIVKCED